MGCTVVQDAREAIRAVRQLSRPVHWSRLVPAVVPYTLSRRYLTFNQGG